MPNSRPPQSELIGKDSKTVPMSCQRVLGSIDRGEMHWIGPDDASALSENDQKAYDTARDILCHLAIKAPRAHKSGHPGGSLSAFTFTYMLSKRRDPHVDQPLRISAGHLSVLSYGTQWLFGRGGNDERLQSPESIIETFRIPSGLPGHVEAGIGDIPFGTGPLGKGVSNGLGVAFGLKYQKKSGIVDVLLADGDSQEGQVQEAFRLASHLKVDNLVVHGDFNDIQLSGLPTETVAADFASIAHATGWHVIEVQNGNDPAQVSAALDQADTLLGKGKPIFICYYTTMGYGVELMEHGSNTGEKNYHGAPLSDDEADEALSKLSKLDELISQYQPFLDEEKKRFESAPRTETDIPIKLNLKKYKRAVTEDKGAARKDFGAVHLKNLMAVDDRIVVLHADLAGSGGFDKVEKEFPERVINVGVAEANMYMMAAGMRQTGLLPVAYTFAAFGINEARANARLIDINCSHTRCGIIYDCTHSGLSVGEDGETHQEQNYYNLPFHHTQVWVPGDSNQAAAMAEKAVEIIAEGHQSVYVFSSRTGHDQLKSPDGSVLYTESYEYDGKANMVRGTGDLNDKATIITTGVAVHDAVAVADELLEGEDKLPIRVVNVSCIRPIDASAILQAALETRHLIVVEDHNNDGGLATIASDIIADFALPCTLRRLGLRHYLPSGAANDLKFVAGIDHESILNAVLDEVRTEVCGGEDAFVSAMYEIIHNAANSRFHNESLDFIQKLREDIGYIDQLREFWKSNACPANKMPDNEELKRRLSSTVDL